MTIGFIKDIGGQKRLRWVRSGYNADNLSLPWNQVVFDSSIAHVYGVLLTGMWSGYPPDDRTRIVSWPSYGYTPLVSFFYSDLRTPGDEWSPYFAYPNFIGTNGRAQELSVDQNGIWFELGNDGADFPCVLRYIVHGMPA